MPEARLTVRDQGTGIDQKYLDRVFEPFFSTKGDLGTGIGLWVAKQLIEGHGGRITMTSSTAPGESGTTVLISLPLLTPHTDLESPTMPPIQKGEVREC